MSLQTPNTKYAVVDGDRYEVPREPDAYRPTTHFGQRLRERVPGSHRDRVIRECFETGVCRGTTPPSSVDRPGVAFQTFEFEARVTHGDFERVYSLVVGVVRDAFRGGPRRRGTRPEDARRRGGGVTPSAKPINHDATVVESQLTDNENRSREVLTRPRERAPVTTLSMIQYASPRLQDSGSTGVQTCDRGFVVSRGGRHGC